MLERNLIAKMFYHSIHSIDKGLVLFISLSILLLILVLLKIEIVSAIFASLMFIVLILI